MTVGSLRPKVPRLSDSEVVSRYQAGESVGLLSLRARVPDYHVIAVLAAAGIRIRGPAEALRLARQQRPWPAWNRAKRA